MRDREKKQYRLILLMILAFVIYLISIVIGNDFLSGKLINDGIYLPETSVSNDDNAVNSGTFDIKEKQVMPSGVPIGIYVKTEGVMVIDTGVISGYDGKIYSPCKDILQQGDYIVSIDGEAINDKKSLVEAVDRCNGNIVDIGVVRGTEELTFSVMPVKNSDGKYKLGIWVKDDISGIGTLTYVDEDSFAALGHSINDNDTGIIFRISDGAIYNANLVNIVKPFDKNPGRLEGIIDYSSANIIGRVKENTLYGISGTLSNNVSYTDYGTELISIAPKEEISLGPAYILSAISGKPEYYDIEITDINYDESAGSKSLEIKITDAELLSMTDGIVQGMSGTPIIQNNRLVGAITHVFVNDSTKGYGIFIEYMLAEND
ncbi:MAG: SpoIVB peptidase [Lachnospiraceae bacterium]|nr:SpoIVB peptidase [Lachnospiraceae bacterium]